MEGSHHSCILLPTCLNFSIMLWEDVTLLTGDFRVSLMNKCEKAAYLSVMTSQGVNSILMCIAQRLSANMLHHLEGRKEPLCIHNLSLLMCMLLPCMSFSLSQAGGRMEEQGGRAHISICHNHLSNVLPKSMPTF